MSERADRPGRDGVAESQPPGFGFVLNVYKEISWSSHHAVDRVRRILGLRKVGHAGTLDPLASGVLLVGVGRATKILPYLVDLPKTYRGTFRLGIQTSTGDLGGALVAQKTVPDLSLSDIAAAAESFLGPYDQVPPMVSAIKHEGKRLYKLARKGVEVERAPRRVVIHRFEILDFAPPRVDFEVECSKGTYVRTLAEDLAGKLETLASVEWLARSAVGGFSIDDSVRLISRPGSQREGLQASAVSMSDALVHLRAVEVSSQAASRVRRGELLPRTELGIGGESLTSDAPFRMLDPGGNLLAIARGEVLPGSAERDPESATLLHLDRIF